MSEPHTAAYWRERAKEAHERAAGMRDPESKQYLLAIARSYDLLALRAEDREAESGNGHPQALS
jgi:hypothetical protein